MSSNVDPLLRSPALHALSADDRAHVVTLLEEQRFAAGATIVREDDLDRHLFILLEGELKLTRRGHDVGGLPVGGLFGEIALLSGRPRSATVVALTDVKLARLSDEAWRALRTSHPHLALELAQAMAASLADQLLAATDAAALLFDGRGTPRSTHPHVRIGGAQAREERVLAGTSVDALLPPVVDGAPVVAALLGPRPVALATPILSDSLITPITVKSWDGREVWRRTAGLLFLAAAQRAAPDRMFTLAHSVGSGRVVRCAGAGDALRTRIMEEMERLVAANATITREQWTVDEARRYFSTAGWPEAERLMNTSRSASIVVHGLAGVYAHAMGPALPTVGSLGGMRVYEHPDGMLLDYRHALGAWIEGGDDAVDRERVAPRFASPMQHEHERWLGAFGVDSVGSFNELCVTGKVRDLIRVSEGFHEKHIGKIADKIASRGGTVRIIAIAGPSSSGKTTFIKRLTVQLEVNGVHPINLSLDDYYADRERCPRDESGELDYEALEALDLALLQRHIRAVLAGEATRTAHFDFKAGRSAPTGGPELKLGARDVLLIEGIHGLNPALLADSAARDQVFRIFVQPGLCLPFDRLTSCSPSDVRFLRRIVRDRHARGSRPEDNIMRWQSVRRGEGKHIFPHQMHADAVFDTSLAYELSVLKVYGERYLLEVPPDHPAFATAYRLRHLLDRFVAIYPDHVPPTSILREFIGGSGFEY